MLRRACRRSIAAPEDRADGERELRRLDAALAVRPEAGGSEPASTCPPSRDFGPLVRARPVLYLSRRATGPRRTQAGRHGRT
jgi:hypothetical protein